MTVPDALAVLADAILERLDKQIEQGALIVEQNQAIIALLSADPTGEDPDTVMTQMGPVKISGLIQKR